MQDHSKTTLKPNKTKGTTDRQMLQIMQKPY